MQQNLPLVLMILDGWGYCKENQHNAIAKAHTPFWDDCWQNRPHLLLEASGTAVGLPDLQMGNSEVGHMHIGAGRLIPQDFTRINQSIAEGAFDQNPVFLKRIQQLKASGKNLHLMGLLSPGGVHSHEAHLFAFIKFCAKQQYKQLCLDLFLDGRDTPPQSAKASLQRLEALLKDYPVAKICSISGRYYAMDRDKRWPRVEKAYQLLTEAKSEAHFDSAVEALESFYQQGLSDEFIPPTRIGDACPIKDGDAIFFFNFRADRARQLTEAFISEQFSGFKRHVQVQLSDFISMTEYSKKLATSIAFPAIQLKNTLGEVLANHHLRQLRIAETEKYAHVTFFLNGGNEQAYPEESRLLIPSPAVATYDLQPEMSAYELTANIIEALEGDQFDVIICNYANADMVGHSGNFEATVKAIECLDKCMHDIATIVEKKGGALIITADHGNAEKMFDEETGQAHTAHTNLKVPFVFIGTPCKLREYEGSLADIAPTLLSLIGISPPAEMTGKALLSLNHES